MPCDIGGHLFFSKELRLLRIMLCFYAVLSLSSMAGMGIGSALVISTALWVTIQFWNSWTKSFLWEIWRGPWGLATLALFFTAFLSLAVADLFPLMGEMGGGFKELKKFHYFLYPPLLAMAFLKTADAIENHPFWKFWAGMGVLSAIVGVVQFFGSSLFPESWVAQRFFRAMGTSGYFHAQGFMFFHLSYAACMSFVACAGLARVLWPRLSDTWMTRALWALVGVAGFTGVFFSFSRISYAGLAAILILLGFLKRIWLGVTAVILSLVLANLAWNYIPKLRDRFEHGIDGNLERLMVWKAAWEMTKDRPLTGVGLGRSAKFSELYITQMTGGKPRFSSHAHNNFLEFLSSTGALGLAAFLAWWTVIFTFLGIAFHRSAPSERWLPAAAITGFVTFLVNGMTQVNFWDGKSQHTLMIWVGVSLALYYRSKEKRSLSL